MLVVDKHTTLLLVLSMLVVGLSGQQVDRVRRQPAHRSGSYKPAHRSDSVKLAQRRDSYRNNGGVQEKGKGGLAELLAGILPNTFYSRPRYRYPYYDKSGKAWLSFSSPKS